MKAIQLFVVLPLMPLLFACVTGKTTYAAAVNLNCTVILPPNPLSAQGLATPYQLVGTDPAMGPCHEANTAQSAFVQAAILDPATGQISAYEPLVIDQGTTPAIAPTAPTLPANAVVGLWFGFNATTLTLQGGAESNCVNGLPGSPFGQFAYCNAGNFFRAANSAIQHGKLHIPALGTSLDGTPCMTTRDFGLVDMDQSDNVQTQYLVNANGQTAQLSAATMQQVPNATVIGNPSDNALLTRFVDPALGCVSATVRDLVNPGTPVSTYATDELMAAADQQAPSALVPAGDEMVLVDKGPSLAKTNLYRTGADQTPATTLNDASTTTYCQNLITTGLPRLQLDMNIEMQHPSPDGGATATSLFTFLANRMNATLGAGGLNCVGLLHIQNPVALTTDGHGVVTTATILRTPYKAYPTPNAGNEGPEARTPPRGENPQAAPTSPSGSHTAHAHHIHHRHHQQRGACLAHPSVCGQSCAVRRRASGVNLSLERRRGQRLMSMSALRCR